MKKFLFVLLLTLLPISLHAQTVINGNEIFVPGASISSRLTNDTSTGTVAHKIAKLTGTGRAVRSGTSDTSGLIGIVAFGAGTSGQSATVQVGQVDCVFDGATTANDYVINSTTVNGDCHDAGAVLPSVQNVGRVLSTNASAGTYRVLVSVSGAIAETATIGGSIATTQIGVGSGTNTLSGSANLTSAGQGNITQNFTNGTYDVRDITISTAPATSVYELLTGTGYTIGFTDNSSTSLASISFGLHTVGDGTVSIGSQNASLVHASIVVGYDNLGGIELVPAPTSTVGVLSTGPLTFSGSTSGSAAIGVAAIAGSPAKMNIPTTTASGLYQVLGSDGGTPQQLSWVTRAKITGSITPGDCVVWVDSETITDALGACGGTILFSGIGTGTNTGASMTVGSGASLTVSGSGTINATTLSGATFAAPGAIGGGTPSTGAFTTITGALTGNVTGNVSGTSATFTGNLTGDATSIAMATTVAKINGTTVPVNSAADQFLRTTGSAVATWATMPDCQDSAGNHVNYTASTHALSCGTSASGAGTTSFSSITGATNTTAAMILGSGSSLTVSGTGTNNATAINATTVPVNAAADQLVITTSSAVGAWKSVPDCTDSAGNHLNYTASTHAFSCGTSASGSGTTSFSSLTGSTNTTAAMVVGTGASLTVSGSGTINATTLNSATFAAPGTIGGGTPANITGLVITANTNFAGALTGNVTGNVSGTAATFTGNLTGDTTSVAMATTTVKVNGTTVPTNAAADQLIRTTSSAVATWATLPNCVDSGGNHINYTTATHLFSCGTSGSGSGVTSVSSGDLTPLFTVSVAAPTSTPAFTFALSNAAANTVFGNCTGSTAAPSYCALVTGQLPAVVVRTDASSTFGAFTYDFSGATILKAKVTAGYAPTVDGQFGVNSTTHLPVFGFNSASTITIPTTIAVVSHNFLTGYTQSTGAFTQTQPTLADIAAGSAPAGLFDFSTGTFKLPVAAGGTVTANGNIRYDSTANNWLAWGNSLSNFINITPSSVTPVNTDCMKWVVTSGVFTTGDFGYKCVKEFSDLNSFSNGVNAISTAGYTILSSDGGKDVTLSNGSGQTVTLPGTVPASGWWVDLQNVGAGTWTSNRNAHNIDGGTTNFSLTTGQGLRIYSDGSNYWTQRGVGSGGPGSVTSVALSGPTGFVISGSPVTSTGTLTFAMPSGWVLGDILYGNGANSVARLAGNLSTTPSVYTSTGTGAAAQIPALISSAGGGANPIFGTITSAAQGDTLCFNSSVVVINCVSGIGIDAQVGTTYTVLSSDRGKFLTATNSSAQAYTLPQAGTTGFANNFFLAIKNAGTGLVTITPTTSQINGGATLVLLPGEQAGIFSDNSNYFSTLSGTGRAIVFGTLPSCSSTFEGRMATITDSTTAVWGATITGGSTNHVQAYCNSSNWTVSSK